MLKEEEDIFQKLNHQIQEAPGLVEQQAQKLLAQYIESGNFDNQFKCYLLLSEVYSHLGNYQKAREVLNPAEKIAVDHGNLQQSAKINNFKGTIHWYQGNYSKALVEYLDLKQIAEKLGDKKLLFNAYNNIGMIYWIEDDFKTAMEIYRKGFTLLKDTSSHNAANVLNNIGICFLKLGQYKEAEEYLLKALLIFEQENDLKLMANSYLNIANSYLETGREEEALKQIEKSLAIKREIKDKWGICHCLSTLGRLYFLDGLMPKSLAAFQEGIAISREIGAKPLAKSLYAIATEYYKHSGDFLKALEYHELLTDTWQEMTQEENLQQIAKLQKDFEVKEKEKENEIFRLRNIELKRKNEQISIQKKKLKSLNDNLQKELNRQLELMRQKDQMLMLQSRQASMGEMMACIAHQWRQPLNGISLITQNLMDGWEYNEFDRDFLFKNCQSMLDLVEFMSNTINDFRNFFRPDIVPGDFNVKDIVQTTLRFVEHSLKQSNINVTLNLKDITAHGFPNYYSQVVMNIINNARDALQEKQVKSPAILIKSFISQRSKHAVLTIEDNAGGIDPEIITKIFNPYFSTKSREKGTGLGLYMSKLIIENNMKGKLLVKNTPSGACFRIEI
ncbi:MAG: tetratricopeptide repeat-containing sensor histidine kinase [Candidatus Cloacimonetes bacterium]|nr:tetratricopeptide repeat-containing sensor histidine kinase [Candidatus Cloacimonadota bacterium]